MSIGFRYIEVPKKNYAVVKKAVLSFWQGGHSENIFLRGAFERGGIRKFQNSQNASKICGNDVALEPLRA